MRDINGAYYVKNKNCRTCILAILAALTLPMEEYYVFGTHVNLNYFAMLLCIPLALKKPLRNLGLRKSFVGLGLFFIFLSLIAFVFHGNEAWFSSSFFNNIIFAIPVTFIILYFYTDTFDIRTFLQWVTVFAVASTVIIHYQRFSFLLTGDYYSNFKLDFIPGIDFAREESLETQIRPSAFFSEPAHYAEFCLPVFAYHLLNKNIWIALLLAFGVIISGSTTGLLCLGVVAISVLLFEHKGAVGRGRRILTALGIVILFGAGYLTMDNYFPEIMAFQFGKLENTDASDSARLLGPVPILLNFDISEWLFGIGMGNKVEYIKAFHIPVPILDGGFEDSMTNTIFSLLIYFGIIGFIVFLIFFVRLYRKCCKGSNVTYILLMFTLFFSANFIFAGNLLYYMFFVANTRYIAQCDNIFSGKHKRLV